MGLVIFNMVLAHINLWTMVMCLMMEAYHYAAFACCISMYNFCVAINKVYEDCYEHLD